MKTIGLLAGMSWQSTTLYYNAINQAVSDQLGGYHSAKIAMISVDFAELEARLAINDYDGIAEHLIQDAKKLEAAGADFVLICTNTMHRVADKIAAAITIPLLHIADTAAIQIKKEGFNKVALLGTAFTMEQDFYKGRLSDKHGLDVITPDENDRKIVHDIIFNELVMGDVVDTSRNEYIRIINELKSRGAEAIILGCTEIVMLIGPAHTDLPLIDTTEIHALEAVRLALS